MATWADRQCRGCGNQFSPASKNQVYCQTCTTQCRVPGCDMKVRARGYCSAHLRQANPVPSIPMRHGDLCGVDGCDRPAHSRGHCRLHYDRVRFYGDVGEAEVQTRKSRGQPCEVDGCDRPARGDGLCITHYARRRKTGEIGPAELLRRADGEGSITETGYKRIKIDGIYYFEHRYVMEQMLGRPLHDGENIHHRDGNRLNNDPENLECWISQQPSGQRVTDLVEYALKILKQYPEQLADEGFRLVALESADSSALLSNDGVTFSDVMRAINADMAE